MNGELLAVLDHIEREKGIKREVLIQAVEAALVSAVRKVTAAKPEDPIKVELDSATGKIRAFLAEKEITSIDFGRIAAQTAKQIIIQKIREAEKDVIFNEFNAKVGEIVSGTVYRFEKGNIIIDLLGRSEGILPYSEQSRKEEFRQGSRIRVFILEVRKEAKGPQIIFSRTNPNFVKKLFELEVPEIYEGIVEIKAISRQPGERTKIAVWSKDEKVDSVGACVGMRGSRVKNIVSELNGEKIDIVRWSDDMKDYISAALSPAKISEIKIDKDNHKAEVMVAQDQLSLAIGKHGQNVRLASKLTGWELDIRTKEMIAEKAKEEAVAQEQPQEEAAESVSLIDIPGIGEKLIAALKEAGFDSLQALANASIDDLTKVKGIGEKKAQKIIAQVKKLSRK